MLTLGPTVITAEALRACVVPRTSITANANDLIMWAPHEAACPPDCRSSQPTFSGFTAVAESGWPFGASWATEKSRIGWKQAVEPAVLPEAADTRAGVLIFHMWTHRAGQPAADLEPHRRARVRPAEIV